MRGLALIFDMAVRHRERPGPGDVDRARMDHRRRVQAVESAAFEHLDLAAATLLGRGAQHVQGDAQVVGQGGECGGRSHSDRRDQVVPARVPEAGQRVVFGAQSEMQLTRSDGGGEGGRQVAVAAGDGEPGVGELIGDAPRRPFLLPGDLRVVEQVAGQSHECAMGPGHRGGDRRVEFDGVVRHGYSSPGTP